MTLTELLNQLETLSNGQRMRRMFELGQQVLTATDPTLAALLVELEQGGFYERLLALQSCYGSHDGAHVLRALRDPSRIIQRMAINLAVLVCDDAEVKTTLENINSTLRLRLLLKLYKRRRYVPIDAFLQTLVAAQDKVNFFKFLAFGTADLVAAHIEQALAEASPVEWQRLARFQPVLFGQAVSKQTTAVARFDRRLLWTINIALPILADSQPDLALTLVQTLIRYVPLGQFKLGQLALRRPTALVTLLLSLDDVVTLDLSPFAHRFDSEQLLALAERQPKTLATPSRWFKRLNPEKRRTIYTASALGWRTAEGVLSADLINWLPSDLRQAEAQRHLNLPVLRTRPAQRLVYASFLPWTEAQATLTPFLRNPDPDLRIVAQKALIATVRFQRGHLGELLTFLRARRNEQDPVRQAIFQSLAILPPGSWKAEHLDDLGQIIRDALDAADLSTNTASYAERLIMLLLPFHPEWSAGWVATLVRERGQVTFYSLENRLSDADVKRIAPILLPVFQSWQPRERENQLLNAAAIFGKRLRVFDELLDIIEQVLQTSISVRTADRALALLSDHRHYRLASLIPALLKQDSSWVTRPVVYKYLHHYRQDLLTPYLGQQAYKGRFSTGNTFIVLPFIRGFQRWTPAQQAIFAETLSHVAGDTIRDSPAVIRTIWQLAGLMAVPPTRLIALASDARPAVRDTALRALGRLDAGQGIPTLLEALGDERVRIAIYALRQALLEMPPSQALSILRNVSLAKVTVAKEAIRLIGDLKIEEAYQFLLALGEHTDLHRDVQVALLRALWVYLERPATWPLLERAAVSTDPAIATIVGRIPADYLSPDAQAKLTALIATLLQHPDSQVRVVILRRCVELPLSDHERVLHSPLLTALTSELPDEYSVAAQAIFATYTGREAELIAAIISQIIGKRRILQTTIEALKMALRSSRRQFSPIAVVVLAALESDSLSATLQLDLAIHALDLDELAKFLIKLATTSDYLHAEALMSGVSSLEQFASFRTDASELLALETSLASQPDARLRRLALAALVAQAKTPTGWDEARRDRLRSYRQDSTALVAAAAQFMFLAEE
jgi:hypothetical protein